MIVDFWELGREYNENRFLNGWFVDRYEMIDKKELNYLLFSLFTEKGNTLFMEELLEYKNKADMLLKIIQLKIVEPEKDKDFLIFLEKDASFSYYDGNYSLDLALRAILNSNKKLKSDLMQMQRTWLLK